jgi:hypothetical protein
MATATDRRKATEFIDQAFRDAIAWKAAAILLSRLRADPAFDKIDPELRGAIERFIEAHPAP